MRSDITTWMLPYICHLLIFVPMAGALLLWAFPREEAGGARATGLVVAGVTLVVACLAWSLFPNEATQVQFAVEAAWIPSFGITYAVGLDGLAMAMVLLLALLTVLALLASWPGQAGAGAAPVTGAVAQGSRDFTALVLLLEGTMMGAFAAQDLLLFYVFWEAMLVPAYFLVGAFGGSRRVHATLQFFLYTMAGSMLLLAAILGVAAVGHVGDTPSFLYRDVLQNLTRANLGPWELLLFVGFAAAFLIKIPILPLHAWLAETYTQAPLTALVLISGVMVKVGAYAFLRYALLLLPHGATLGLPLLLFLATASCLWAAWVAYGQSSLRRVLAYGSMGHMGLLVVGLLALTPLSVTGSAVQMVNHGILAGGLFLWLSMLERRRGTSHFVELGGLAEQAPSLALCFILLSLAFMGLPGLSGFVGEFLILLGTFNADGLGLSTPESTFAQGAMIGLLTGGALLATYATWLLYTLDGMVWRSTTGRFLRVLGAGLVWGLAYGLVAVPTQTFAGGLLVRPLVRVTLSAQPFTVPFRAAGCFAVLSVIMGAAYMLRGIEKTLFGSKVLPLQAGTGNAAQPLCDLSAGERWILAVPLGLSVLLGVYPAPLVATVEPTARAMVTHFRQRAGWPAADMAAGALNSPAAGSDPASPCPYLSLPPTPAAGIAGVQSALEPAPAVEVEPLADDAAPAPAEENAP